MTEQLPASVYPARLEIDYPDQHDRVTTLFRVFLVIPIAIVIGILTAGATQTVYNQSGQVVRDSSGGISTGLFLATLLMILFARRYPRWWFDFALELARFGTRIGAYVALLTDQAGSGYGPRVLVGAGGWLSGGSNVTALTSLGGSDALQPVAQPTVWRGCAFEDVPEASLANPACAASDRASSRRRT